MQNLLKNKLNIFKGSVLMRIALTALLVVSICASLILVYKAENIYSIDTGNQKFTVHTLSGDLKDALKTVGLDIEAYKITHSERNGKIFNLSLEKSFPVFISTGIEVKKVKAIKSTVGEILDIAGIFPDELTVVEPAVDTVISDTALIEVSEIVAEEAFVEEPVEEIHEVDEIAQAVDDAAVSYSAPAENPVSLTSALSGEHVYTSFLTKKGGVYRNPYTGLRETYYSQRVLPGYGLKIPGRHVNEEGFVCDEEGYICVASNDFAKGTVIETSRGMGKVYDCGCARGTLDLYVNW